MLLRDDQFASQIRQSVTSAASNVNELVAGMKAGQGPAGMLLRDEAVAGQVREALKNVQQARADLSHASHQVNAMISDLNSQQIPQKAGAAIDILSQSSQQVRQLVSEISQADRQGMTAGANIRESLTNVNDAGLNLADGTEALKHNFLVRGFFPRRGYYNLDHISPEKYRQDRVFTSSANYRAWVSASELFQEGSNGQEELSIAGRALLDGALSEGGDSIFRKPHYG